MDPEQTTTAAGALETQAYEAAKNDDYEKASTVLQELMDTYGDDLDDEARKKVGWNLGLSYIGAGQEDYGRQLLEYYGYSPSEIDAVFAEE